MNRSAINRREFLKSSAAFGAAIAFPAIIPARARGAEARPAPSGRIVMAAVGLGWRGGQNFNTFMNFDDVQLVALCDVDTKLLEATRKIVNEHYGDEGCAVYTDFRELFARPDLDAVVLSLPDHWHTIVAVEAMRAGLDVYGEKPLTHDLREGRAICDAVRRYGRVFQTGSQQRSAANMHKAAELVRNGRIGRVRHIEVGIPPGFTDFAKTADRTSIEPPPPHLDYETWLGPAPWSPYRESCVHKNWRWVMDTGGGNLLDWIGHHGDIAVWGMGLDETGPAKITATGVFPTDGVWDAPLTVDVNYEYADGLTMHAGSMSGGMMDGGGTKWFGDDGWVHVNRGFLQASSPNILLEEIDPGEHRLYHSRDHHRNFLDCVRSRRPTIATAEIGHRSASLGHLGMISILTGRALRWNPATETIENDPGAEALLGRADRSPWTL